MKENENNETTPAISLFTMIYWYLRLNELQNESRNPYLLSIGQISFSFSWRQWFSASLDQIYYGWSFKALSFEVWTALALPMDFCLQCLITDFKLYLSGFLLLFYFPAQTGVCQILIAYRVKISQFLKHIMLVRRAKNKMLQTSLYTTICSPACLAPRYLKLVSHPACPESIIALRHSQRLVQ